MSRSNIEPESEGIGASSTQHFNRFGMIVEEPHILPNPPTNHLCNQPYKQSNMKPSHNSRMQVNHRWGNPQSYFSTSSHTLNHNLSNTSETTNEVKVSYKAPLMINSSINDHSCHQSDRDQLTYQYEIKPPSSPIDQSQLNRHHKYSMRRTLGPDTSSSFYAPQSPLGGSMVPSTTDVASRNEEPMLQAQQIQDYFSEMVDEGPEQRDRLLIVLDAANIGWHYGCGESFVAEGVAIAVDNLSKFQINGNAACQCNDGLNGNHLNQSRVLEIIAFLPFHYFRIKPRNGGYTNGMMQTENVDILEDLARAKLLAPVPSNDSDDAYILNYARENNGFIISNDRFQDHLKKITNPSIQMSMQVWLSENSCSYTFHGDEFIINPSSRLAFALRTRSTDISDPLIDSTMPLLLKMEGNISRQLTKIGEDLLKLHRPQELKFVLLARAHLYLECGSFNAAWNDTQYILQQIDPNCSDAWTLLEKLKIIENQLGRL